MAHTLRKLIGDDDFFKSIRILVYGRPDPKPGNFTPQFGTTEGFLKIVNDVTGKDYKWFFDVYFYRAALPKVIATRDKGLLRVRWQTPDNLPFPMPLELRVDGKVVTLPMTDGTGQVPAARTRGRNDRSVVENPDAIRRDRQVPGVARCASGPNSGARPLISARNAGFSPSLTLPPPTPLSCRSGAGKPTLTFPQSV